MGNKDPEKNYDNLTDALQFVFEQMLKSLYIDIPGIIESYNNATKRAIVRPAVKLKRTTGQFESQASIVDVPVIWPGGGGFILYSQLVVGNPVTIWFSQRGIEQFKETFAESSPGIGLFNKEDAYVVPGFGALSITPATSTGISMQSDDGQNYIVIEDDVIKIVTPGAVTVECATLNAAVSGTTNITCPNVNLTGNLNITGNITLTDGDIISDGISLETHAHPILGGSSAPGPTGPPE